MIDHFLLFQRNDLTQTHIGSWIKTCIITGLCSSGHLDVDLRCFAADPWSFFSSVKKRHAFRRRTASSENVTTENLQDRDKEGAQKYKPKSRLMLQRFEENLEGESAAHVLAFVLCILVGGSCGFYSCGGDMWEETPTHVFNQSSPSSYSFWAL